MSWIAYSFIGMLLVGVGNFLLRFASAYGQPALSTAMIQFGTMFSLASVIYFFKKTPIVVTLPCLVTAIAGGACIGLGSLAIVSAFNHPNVQSGVATAIFNANFVLVLLLGLIVLHEVISWKQGLGMACIVFGMLMMI